MLTNLARAIEADEEEKKRLARVCVSTLAGEYHLNFLDVAGLYRVKYRSSTCSSSEIRARL